MGEIFKRPMPAANLPFTGERLTPELTGQTEIEHLHRYFLARHMCRGKDVLDVASGEGYGSALLAQVAKSVVGVELAEDVVAHANTEYGQSNVCFRQGDARELPIPDASIDVAVSFETIEHFDGHDRFLSEIRRVLRPGGRLVISTPDRDHYSPTGAPANPFHVLEMTRSEFSALLSQHFAHVVLALQRPMIGSVMLASEVGGALEPLCFEKRGDHIESSNGLGRPQYAVGIASDQPIEPVPATVYIETSLLGAREQELRAEGAAQRAAADLAEAEALRHRADTLAAERDAAQGSLAELRRALDVLRADLAEVEALRHRTDALTAERDTAQGSLAELRREVDALRADLAEVEALRYRADTLAAERDAAQGSLAELRHEADALRAESAKAEALRQRADTLAAERDAAQGSLADLRREVDVLRADLAKVEALRHHADTLAAERDAAQGSLAELRREVDALRAEVAGLWHANERAEEACAVVRHQLGAERAHVIHLQGEVTRLEGQVAARQEHVSALLASTSWRVTEPLRAVVRFGRGRAGPHP
jgi:2-polyprenyl-3-methyl-5-hydroxy-6-metoxy-1,4-benzoquinol methylase/uncharacterized coiled-coil DUF342 family protein